MSMRCTYFGHVGSCLVKRTTSYDERVRFARSVNCSESASAKNLDVAVGGERAISERHVRHNPFDFHLQGRSNRYT